MSSNLEISRRLEPPTKPTELGMADFRRLAENASGAECYERFPQEVEQAILIRQVELKFLDLFARGAMNGTVHTCIGQEFSAVAVAGALEPDDWITSNHRCHGHFIAKTGDWRALVDELMGLESGVCKGVGSSQHLFTQGFLSNGPQGALVPVGTGIGLHLKQTTRHKLAASFIGEGTLGEGVLHEAMNLAALWSVPQLFVCENNLYSQSTPQGDSVAGFIPLRAAALGMRVFEADTWNLDALFETARAAIDHVRETRSPAFLLIRTYRLKAHSKGDDDRDPEEIRYFEAHDPLTQVLESAPGREARDRIAELVDAHVAAADAAVLDRAQYQSDQLPRRGGARTTPVTNPRVRMVQALNDAYQRRLEAGAVMLGEDICDPYGGAFKVTRGLSTRFPDQVLNTPISEAAIAGVGGGLALMGREAYVEIMFGDFMTNVFDQLISNFSKFHHMYAFQATVPVRLRTPMGGKRGYGPTHSQSLEKHLVGIDNVLVLALSSLEDPADTLEALGSYPGPAVIIENKVDYGKVLWQPPPEYALKKLSGEFGHLVVTPRHHGATATLVAYGGTAREIADAAEEIFRETDQIFEMFVPTRLHPIDVSAIFRSAGKTGQLIVVEDGSVPYGIGAEIGAQLAEAGVPARLTRIGAEPVPIPSVASLETALLASVPRLIEMLAPQEGASVAAVKEGR